MEGGGAVMRVVEDRQAVGLVRVVGQGGLFVPGVVDLEGVEDMEDTVHTESICLRARRDKRWVRWLASRLAGRDNQQA